MINSTAKEIAMNAKLILAVIAALAAVPSYAAQQFGRDSVYATPGVSTNMPSVVVPVVRFGRDSVYATQGPIVQRQPVTTTAVAYKPGRA
jgi:hypothetical protein